MKQKIKLEKRFDKYYYKVVNNVRTKITRATYYRLSGQSSKLVTKTGKVLNEKLLKRLEKQYGRAEVSIVLRDIRETPGKTATYKYVKAKLASSALDRLFINLGRSPEELAAEINVNVTDIKDSNNWKDSKFYSPDGKVYEVFFNYESSVFQEIKADE